jgi:hypothetical protein
VKRLLWRLAAEPTSNGTPAPPRAPLPRRGSTNREPLSASGRQPPPFSLQLCLPKGESDADEIRHAVRPMVACQRHPPTPTFTEGKRQQADDPSHAKGQPWLGENEGQTPQGVFGARWATGQGSRTFRDSEPVSGGYSAVCGTPSVVGAWQSTIGNFSDRTLEP